MSFLEKNKNILLSQYPGLYEVISLKNDDDLTPDDIKIELTHSGEPTICIKGIYIHSQRDPLREGQRLAESVSAERGPVIILGFGLGYAAQAAANLNRKEDFRPIIIVEKHKSLLLKAMELRDFSGFLSENRVLFIIGGSGEGITSAIKIASDMILERQTGEAQNQADKKPSVIRNKALVSLDEQWYGAVDARIRAWAVKDDINQATHKRFGQRWVRNLTRNMSALRDYPGISRLEGLVCKEQKTESGEQRTINNSQSAFPVFLAAAGPSLDNIKPLLRDIYDRCVIVAVDTSLRFFLQNGIQPDFVVVVDPQFWNSRHLDRCISLLDNQQADRSQASSVCGAFRTALIAETAVYPTIMSLPFKNKFVCSSMFPLGTFVEILVDPKGRLAAGGSVATSAWDFARTLGAQEIWIAGLDLAFPGLKTHFRGARFEVLSNSKSCRFNPVEKWVVRALRDGFPFKANSAAGGQVLTDKRLSLYAAWFENYFSKYPHVKNFSLFQKGISIQGIQPADTEKFLALPRRRDEIDKCVNEAFSKIENEFNAPPEKQTRRERYKNAVSELNNGLENVKNEAAKGVEIARHAINNKISISEQDKIFKDLEAIMRHVTGSKFIEITDFMALFVEDEKDERKSIEGEEPFRIYLNTCLELFLKVLKAAEFYLAQRAYSE